MDSVYLSQANIKSAVQIIIIIQIKQRITHTHTHTYAHNRRITISVEVCSSRSTIIQYKSPMPNQFSVSTARRLTRNTTTAQRRPTATRAKFFIVLVF